MTFRNKYIGHLVLLIFIFSNKVFSNNDFDEDKLLKIISTINNSIEENQSERHCLEKIDSIAYSYKDVWDFSNERSDFERSRNLGNFLTVTHHRVQYLLEIDYVEYHTTLLKIRYVLNYGNNTVSDSAKFVQFANSVDLNLTYGKKQFIFSKSYPGGDEKIKKSFPLLNFQVFSSRNQDNIDFVNDPLNNLTYGFACSVAGAPPFALRVFAGLVHYKEYSIIEKLLYSPNPVTRLYSADALVFLSGKRYIVLDKKTSSTIEEIYSDNKIFVNMCIGCSFQNMSIKEAKLELQEQMENPYQNIGFNNTE